jgi:hypothetical protein
MNQTIIKRPDWFFYPGWVLANVLAIALSWFAYFPIIDVVTRFVGQTIQVNGKTRITEDYLFMVIFFPTLCLLSGVFQYILLRLYLPKIGGWVLATGAGCLVTIAVIGLLTSVFDFATNSIWGDALIFSIIGGLFGLSQWILLRHRIPKAGWWILASMLGWGLGVLSSLTSVRNGSALAQLLTFILSPAIVACFAWWFLLNPKEGEEILLSGS